MTSVSILHRFLQTASSEIQKLVVNVKIYSKKMVSLKLIFFVNYMIIFGAKKQHTIVLESSVV